MADGVDEKHIIEVAFDVFENKQFRDPNVDMYVTGSNAVFFKDVITEFGGRCDEVRMYLLSFAEFISAYLGTMQDGWNEYI